MTPGGSQPQGISAGYLPGNSQVTNDNVNGTVTVDNFANVTAAAGWGINTYNFGNGSINVTDESGTTVSGAQYGIQAYSQGTVSGNVTITVNVVRQQSALAPCTDWPELTLSSAIAGNISIYDRRRGDTINSGGTGIQANNQTNPTTGTSSGQISITTSSERQSIPASTPTRAVASLPASGRAITPAERANRSTPMSRAT